MTTASDSEQGRRVSSAIVRLAGAMVVAIHNDEAVRAALRELLKATGRDDRLQVMTPAMVSALVDQLTTVFTEVVLPEMLDGSRDAHLANIRRLFLDDPNEDYSVTELAALWRMSVDDLRHFLNHEIGKWEDATDQPFRMSWADAVDASTRFNLLRAFDVEVALGDDFERARPDKWRTLPLLIRLPRFVVEHIGDPAMESFKGHRDLAVRVEDLFLELYQEANRGSLSELADDEGPGLSARDADAAHTGRSRP